MGDSNILDVQTELGVVKVHKMPLKDYAELLRAFKNLPQMIAKFTDSGTELKDMSDLETLDLIRDMLIDSWDDLIAIVAVPTDQDAETLGKLDGTDSIEVIDAILELNDIPRIIAAVKKILARRAKIVKAQAKS